MIGCGGADDVREEEVRACIEERAPDPDDALAPTWETFQEARRRFFAVVSGHAGPHREDLR